MSRILVIGGFGFYGTKVVERLRSRGHSVVASSRALEGREGLELDLADPEVYAKLSEFDAIVNASDSVNAPPDALARQVLEFGGTWVELGAHAPTVARLLALDVGPHPLGTLIVGAGVFPGFSSVLARKVAGGDASSVELGVRFSPLSGAGPGNCALMAESLFIRAKRYEDGKLRSSLTAVGKGASLPFDSGEAPGQSVTLPDIHLIGRVTEARTIGTYLSVDPGYLRFMFRVAAWVSLVLRPLRRLLVPLQAWMLTQLRAKRLRETKTSVELVAVANRGTEHERRASLSFEDGHDATARGAAAVVEAWLRRGESRRPFGVFGVAELFELPELQLYARP